MNHHEYFLINETFFQNLSMATNLEKLINTLSENNISNDSVNIEEYPSLKLLSPDNSKDLLKLTTYGIIIESTLHFSLRYDLTNRLHEI